MKITIICSNKQHPVYAYLERWRTQNSAIYDIELLNSARDISSCGDILFLISCSEIIKEDVRKLIRYSLVLHASDLPQGRGWSPHIWDVINGKNELVLSLLNAEDGIDTGSVWQKRHITLSGYELYHEINHKLFEAELSLISWACKFIDSSIPLPQDNTESSYHRKRTSEDSQLDADCSIRSQFNLLRVCDPERFPAHVMIDDKKYIIKVERVDD